MSVMVICGRSKHVRRHWNTADRMEDLLSKISDQLLQACHVHIVHVEYEETRGNLWKKSPESVRAAIAECQQLHDVFVDHYR